MVMRNLLENQHRLLLLHILSFLKVVLVAAAYLLLDNVLSTDHLVHVGVHLAR
jgi:hypothetical protein